MYVGTHAHSQTHIHKESEKASVAQCQQLENLDDWSESFFFFGKCEILKLKKLLKRLAAHSKKSLFIPEDFLKEI